MSCRILHIIDSLERQGAAGQLCLLAACLPGDQFSNRVVSLGPPGPHVQTLARAGVQATSLARRWPFDPIAIAKLCRAITDWRPDIIHTWTPAARDYGAVASRWCGIGSLVIAWRSVDRIAPRWQQRCAAGRASVNVVNSSALLHACQGLGSPSEKLRMIPNGVAVPSPVVATRRQLLDRLQLDDSVRLIAAAGPLFHDRRLKDVIWAADLLKVLRDDVHLLIFGDGPHRRRLQLFRDQVEIADKVHFMGDASDLADWLPHVDLFWSARQTSGTANAVLEAMAAGRPVVACDAPGMRELVVHERTGYLVRSGHRAGLAQWAEHLLNHSEHARELGEAGRARALAEFSVEKMVAGYADLYRQVAAT